MSTRRGPIFMFTYSLVSIFSHRFLLEATWPSGLCCARFEIWSPSWSCRPGELKLFKNDFMVLLIVRALHIF